MIPSSRIFIFFLLQLQLILIFYTSPIGNCHSHSHRHWVTINIGVVAHASEEVFSDENTVPPKACLGDDSASSVCHGVNGGNGSNGSGDTAIDANESNQKDHRRGIYQNDGSGNNEQKEESDSSNEENNVSSAWAFMRSFSKMGSSWNHVISEYISVVNNADGKDLKGDVFASSWEEGLKLLHGMVNDARREEEMELTEKAGKEDRMVKTEMSDESGGVLLKWSFQTTPFEEFDKTLDDLLLAFLRWSDVDSHSIDEDDTTSCKLIGGINYHSESTSTPGDAQQKINVSKAFRRLQSYTSWMSTISSHLLSPPLTFQSIQPSLDVFSLQITHDACSRLVWWVNLGKTNLALLRTQSTKETMRMFVYIAHLLFLDPSAQLNGLLVIDDMSHISFWDYMTMLPVQVGISIDRFLISVTPVKAKNVVLMHRPKWAEIGYGLLSWFLSEKMKMRVTMIENGMIEDEVDTLIKVVGGKEYMPREFGEELGGEIKMDIIAEMRAKKTRKRV